jgi:hypothetical protein
MAAWRMSSIQRIWSAIEASTSCALAS